MKPTTAILDIVHKRLIVPRTSQLPRWISRDRSWSRSRSIVRVVPNSETGTSSNLYCAQNKRACVLLLAIKNIMDIMKPTPALTIGSWYRTSRSKSRSRSQLRSKSQSHGTSRYVNVSTSRSRTKMENQSSSSLARTSEHLIVSRSRSKTCRKWHSISRSKTR